MAVQYLYPSGVTVTLHTGGTIGFWRTNDGSSGNSYTPGYPTLLASKIDEGISIANVSDYIDIHNDYIIDFHFPEYTVFPTEAKFTLMGTNLSGCTYSFPIYAGLRSDIDPSIVLGGWNYSASLLNGGGSQSVNTSDDVEGDFADFSNPSGLFEFNFFTSSARINKYSYNNNGIVVRLEFPAMSIKHRYYACELFLSGDPIPPLMWNSRYNSHDSFLDMTKNKAIEFRYDLPPHTDISGIGFMNTFTDPPFYICGPSGHIDSLELHTVSYPPIPYSGDYNPTLYTHGPTPCSSDYNPTLFLNCRPENGDMPLYTVAYNNIHTNKRGRHYYPVAFSQTENSYIFSTYPGRWQNQVGQSGNTLYQDIDESIDNIDESDYISATSTPAVFNPYNNSSSSRSETAVIKFGPTVDFAPSSGTMIVRYKSDIYNRVIENQSYNNNDGVVATSQTEIRSLDFPYYPNSYGTDPYNYFPLEESNSTYIYTYREPDTFITKEIHWPINSFPDISGYYGKDMTFAVELSQFGNQYYIAQGYNITIATMEIVLYEDVGSIEPTLFLKSDGPDEGIPLYISHANTLDSLPTGLPLFIQGHGADYSGLDLNIIGGMSKSFDLYIRSNPEAYSTSSSGTTLVIWPLGAGGSGTPTGSTTIYTLNYNNESGECPLYISVIESGTFERNTPLFLQSTRFYPNNDNISLNVWANGAGGSGYPSYESSLYVCHADISDGYIPLYIPVLASGERDDSFPIHLYNLGFIESNPSQHLTLWNKTVDTSGYSNLFITSFHNEFSGFPITMVGPTSGGFVDSVPFYSKSVDPTSLNNITGRNVLPLVILNKLKHGSGIVELSIGNGFPISGNPTLFVEGGGIVDNLDKIDLYINSRISYSGNMPLVTTAGLSNSYHDLYVQAKELTFSSGDSTLFIYSADGSGIYNANDLFMSSAVYGTRTPLFIATHEYGTPNSGFPLYMENQQNSTLGMDIYLESLRSSSNSIKFHTGGEGFIDGASVQRGEIPLYIARPNNADGYSTLLHINGPSGETSGLEMSIMGGTYSVGNVNLTMPTVMGTKNGNMEIYSHGF